MEQLYLLSTVLNGLAAYIFISQEAWEIDSIETGLKFSVHNQTFRLILGILAAVIGLLKLLMPFSGRVPFIGDLVPALGGLAAGFLLVFGYYRDHGQSVDFGSKLDIIGDTVLKWKKVIGFILMISVLLHFLFPKALFL